MLLLYARNSLRSEARNRNNFVPYVPGIGKFWKFVNPNNQKIILLVISSADQSPVTNWVSKSIKRVFAFLTHIRPQCPIISHRNYTLRFHLSSSSSSALVCLSHFLNVSGSVIGWCKIYFDQLLESEENVFFFQI